MKNKFYLIIATLIFSINAFAQTPTYQWAFGVATNQGFSSGFSIANDPSGNVLTTGLFTGSPDFNPGAGVNTLVSNGAQDAFVAKYDPAGNYLWAFKLGSTMSDWGYGITSDASGNVIVTGYFNGTLDFDPGAGVANLTANGNNDVFVAKYNSAGNYIWAFLIGSTNADEGRSVKTDASGNVYITGFFSDIADFDPSVSTATISALGQDIYVAKYTSAGNYVWAFNVGSSLGNSCIGNSIDLDAAGNVVLTGHIQNICDFDPGPGVANLNISATYDVFVAKYTSAGNYVWAFGYGGGGAEEGYSIGTDASNNVYVTGYISGATVDVDPGAGVANLTASGNDMFLAKYNSSGNYVSAFILGSAGEQIGRGLSVNANGDCYVTGTFVSGISDFDPGAGTANLSPIGSVDAFVAHYNSSGAYQWAFQIGGVQFDGGYSISLSSSGYVHVIGGFQNTVDFNPGAGTNNLTALSTADTYIAKYTACNSSPIQPSSIIGLNAMCSGAGASTYSVLPVAEALSYTWSLPGGWSGSSSTNTISATPGTTGVFSVTASNACGTSSAQTLSVAVNPLLIVTATASPSSSICIGLSVTLAGGGASTYTWSGGVTNAVAFSPTTTSTYTVTGTDINSCQNTATKTITVNPLPTVTYSQTPSLVCANNTSVPLTGVTPSGGAFSGTAVTGATFNAVTAGVGSYTITYTYTDVNSCVNTATSNITVSACTGIQQNTIANEIMIYPNPFSSIITLQGIETGAIVEVFNLLGEKIYSSQLTKDKTEINLSNESNGIYFIKTGTVTKKIIKQ